jgi:predicted glycosyltransferase
VGVVYLPSQTPLLHFLKGLIRKWERKIDPVIFLSKKIFKNRFLLKYFNVQNSQVLKINAEQAQKLHKLLKIGAERSILTHFQFVLWAIYH